MKSLFLFLAMLATSISQAETPVEVSPAIRKSFETTFKNAREVDWTVSTTFAKAQFALDGQYINAFYDNDGSLIALTRNITASQLPMMLQTSLKTESANYWISDLFEISNEEGTSYYVTLENADNKIVLKSSDNKDWTSYKKIRKV
ncbi:MAG: hypothetical protein JWP27_1466 [Flaviaesturariibacter sp.]|nr:hypothetical protein [Flaviaesturariibacter sp.]